MRICDDAMTAVRCDSLLSEGEENIDGNAGAECSLFFRCQHCVKLIADGRPLYMRRDACYCSSSCRRKGRSGQYAQFTGVALEEHAVERSRSVSCLSTASSGAFSDFTQRTASSSSFGWEEPGSGDRGLVGRLVGRAVRRAASLVGRAVLLRSLSSIARIQGRSSFASDPSLQLFGQELLPEPDWLLGGEDPELFGCRSGLGNAVF